MMSGIWPGKTGLIPDNWPCSGHEGCPEHGQGGLGDLIPHVCNFADDTTLYACDIELQNVLHDLEDNALITAIIWFENNYMKLNQSKCHLLTNGSTEHLWVKVGDEMIWESQTEKLLGMSVDKDPNFNSHLKSLSKK